MPHTIGALIMQKQKGLQVQPFLFLPNRRNLRRRTHANLSSSSCAHPFDSGGQAALVASGLVLVNDLLISDAVDRALGSDENLLSSLLVTAEDRLADSLDGSAQTRTQAHVEGAGLDCLTGALTGLCRIGHLLVILKEMQ